jgi:hypothetical protein
LERIDYWRTVLRMNQHWSRRLAVAAAVLFLVSSAFPVVAGLSHNTASFSKWWGILDGGLTSVLAALAFVMVAVTQGKVNKQAEYATYRTYRILTHGILLMLVVFFLVGDRIIWSNCLTGFAWRTWLLLYTLPAWVTAAIPQKPLTSAVPGEQQLGDAT